MVNQTLKSKIKRNTRTILIAGLIPLTVFGCTGPRTQIDIEKGSGICYSLTPPRTQIDIEKGSGTCYSLTQEEGESQINSLAQTNPMEDAWVYLGNNKWLDVGIREDSLSAGVDSALVASSGKQGDTIYFYHPHPMDKEDPEAIYAPSASDIRMHASKKRELKEKGINLVSKIFDGHGMWEYDIGEKALAEITNGNPYNINFALIVGGGILDDKTLTREDKIKKYIAKMEESGVDISYFSF